MKKILILGGTRDARIIARNLHRSGHDVTTSLAGVTQTPQQPDGKVRIGGFGGFGGARGLGAYLSEQAIDVLIDATHPFAAVISRNAEAAVHMTGVRHLRFERPAWEMQAGDTWIEVENVAAAARVLPQGSRVLVTIGRKEVAPFLKRSDLSGLIRSIEAPDEVLPPGWCVLLERPPFTVEDEIALLRDGGFSSLVSKNSGGDETAAKLVAARHLGVPIVMVRRPVKSGGERVTSVAELAVRLAIFP